MSNLLARATPKLFPRHDHSSYTPSELAEMLIDPYEDTPKYARYSIYFLGGGVILFGLVNLWGAFRRTRIGARVAKSKFQRRKTAAFRYIATLQPRPVGFIHFPTVGVICLIVAFWLFIGIWSLAQQPYYRSRWNVGSPPLAMRTGLFALGIFPFILAFGAKWNLVTFVTGYSHEKLQVFHQWLSHLFLILSLLHTFPFVMAGREIRPNADGLNPHGYGQLYYSWHVSHKVYYWSGVAALVPLIWLCWGSLAPIRNRSYEIFKVLHIISAILFSAFFYIHCNNLLFSWEYLWATAAIYGTSVVMRFGLLLVRNGTKIPQASIEPLADDALRITIKCPEGHRWKAGQHFFVNFVKAASFESHPYTIANAPFLHPNAQAPERTMQILLRPYAGSALAPRLRSLAARNATTPVLLDGPYGGLTGNADLSIHETVLLFAGGAGASFATALVEELCEKIRRAEEGTETKKIEVHWAVRHEEALSWFQEHFDTISAIVPPSTLELNLYVTGGEQGVDRPALEKPRTEEAVEKHDCCSPGTSTSSIKRSSATWTIHEGRPNLHAIITDKLANVAPGSTVGMGSCGPSGATGFTADVRRAVAARQLLIAKGLGGDGAEEVELHTEEFAW